MLMAFELLLNSIPISGAMHRLTRYSKRRNTRRAISPVIATVILVSTAVVISAAMAGFAGSLFGTYSQSSQIRIRDATFSNSASTVTINFVNSGPSADNLQSVSVPFGATTLTATGTNLSPNPAVLLPNSNSQIVASFSGTMPDVGQRITMTASTTSGQAYTFSVIVGQ